MTKSPKSIVSLKFVKVQNYLTFEIYCFTDMSIFALIWMNK